MIAFNKPYTTGKEVEYITEALSQQRSGNGTFTKKCHHFFQKKYGFAKTLLTSSCTDALEMTALLLNLKSGDEVIMPSFTFVSTANAFLLRGAEVVFADSSPHHPNIDPEKLPALITSRTKAIVVVHYAGMAVDMEAILNVAKQYGLFVIEDAAQAIDAYYKDKPLGTFGHLACFSFHDTKNIVSGEGGMLVINDQRFVERAEIIWEKGTNRSAFVRGEVDKYGWVDVGSSFLPSELTAAFLYAQLEQLDNIQKKRMDVWNFYWNNIQSIIQDHGIELPVIPSHSRHNAHIFFLVCQSSKQRDYLIDAFKMESIQAYFHYPPLHLSKYYTQRHSGVSLPCAVRFSETLIRLPLYPELCIEDQKTVLAVLRSAVNRCI
jgi:dTDP-4-amino-4,6-dideoxygalactose transaminase